MPKYNPQIQEKKWQDFWQKNSIFKFNPQSDKPIFSIDTPPPTISGKLHLGHIFSYTHTEIIARYRRLVGFNVYYPFGMDDNGLPTERLVEQELGIKGSDFSRPDFTKKCLDLVKIYRQKYRDLWQSIGLSVDWDLEYSTISAPVQKLTQTNFLNLYRRGIIYRQKAPSLWCSVCQTSVAQAEVEDKSQPSVFYDLTFSTLTGQPITVATTRPELLPACVAVLVHPEDEKHRHLLHTNILTPLGDQVPVYSDRLVKIDKGSGVVMVCTYGDETDLTWKKQFNLPETIILDKNGLFSSNCSFKPIVGKTIAEGRQIIVDYLKSKNLVTKELPLVHDVGCHERCSHPIEIINTDQWFLKVLDYRQELLKIADQINWHPIHMKQRYLSWVENLKWDWCLSRDRFYGVAVPAFYCPDCGNIILPDESELPLDPLSQGTKNRCPDHPQAIPVGDPLIFDTWFTSGNTPEINTNLNQKLTGQTITIPMSLRPNAHDIIRTWDFYTIVLAFFKYQDIPWKDVAISGHILLRKGEKISKRTGGGNLRPEDEIAKYSADAIRYAMSGTSLGTDAYYDEKEIQNGQKLITKLDNVANFCRLTLENYRPIKFPALSREGLGEGLNLLTPLDQWFLAESQITAASAAKYFNNYDYSHAREVILKYFWEIFCDNYLEIIKKRLYDLPTTDPTRLSAQYTLFSVFYNLVLMLTPFIPHITEEIYQTFFQPLLSDSPQSINYCSWPKSDFSPKSTIVPELLKIISLVRAQKSQSGIPLSKDISCLNITHPSLTLDQLQPYLFDLQAVTRAKEVNLSSGEISLTLHP